MEWQYDPELAARNERGVEHREIRVRKLPHRLHLVAHMSVKAITDAYHSNMSTPGVDGPPRIDCVCVPDNIAQLTSRIKPVGYRKDDSVYGFASDWVLKTKQPANWAVAAKKHAGKPTPSIAKKFKAKKACRTT